MMCVIGAAVC